MLLLAPPPPVLLLPAGKPRGRKPSPAVAPIPLRRPLRVFSFGGGVQSHAVLVMQALGKLPVNYDIFAFANVGNDSENPETLEYIERYTRPFCRKHGIEFIEVQKQRGRGKNKTPDTLVLSLYRDTRSVIIPARMGHNGALGNRNCTEDFKIAVVDALIRSTLHIHAYVGLGISTDEIGRVKSTAWHQFYGKQDLKFVKRRHYPLIEAGVNRAACKKIITDAGLPEPPKSSCYFCPFHKRGEWITMKREQPELFAKAVEIERQINKKRVDIGRDGLYLHPSLVPLDRAVGDQPLLFPDEMFDECDSGYCWT